MPRAWLPVSVAALRCPRA